MSTEKIKVEAEQAPGSPVKVNIDPKPVEVGRTAAGEKVWLDPHDLVLTPDEQEELASNRKDAVYWRKIQQIAKAVIDNASLFAESTCMNVMPGWAHKDIQAFVKWADASGLNVEINGLNTVICLNIKGVRKPLRELRQSVAPAIEPDVVATVTRMLAENQF